MKDFDALRPRCADQIRWYVTPTGREMYYRYQEWLIDEAKAALAPGSAAEAMTVRHIII
jgi:hypothetical protein